MKKYILLIILLSVICISGTAQDKKNTSNFSKDSIKLVDIEPFTYIALEQTGSYNKQNEAFTQLWEESVKQFLSCGRGYFILMHNPQQNTAEENLKWEAATKLMEDDEITDPLKKKQWDYKKVAKVIYEGTLDSQLIEAYAKTIEWAGENGYQIEGPTYQRYLGRVQPNADGVLVGKVEIWMPVSVTGH